MPFDADVGARVLVEHLGDAVEFIIAARFEYGRVVVEQHFGAEGGGQHVLFALYAGGIAVGQGLAQGLLLVIHVIADAVAGQPADGRADAGADQGSLGVAANGLSGQGADAGPDPRAGKGAAMGVGGDWGAGGQSAEQGEDSDSSGELFHRSILSPLALVAGGLSHLMGQE